MDAQPSTSTHPPIGSEVVPTILTFCAISLLLIFLVYSGNFVFGSEPGNWTYPYFKTITSISRRLPILIFALLGVIIYAGSKLIFTFEKLMLLGSVLMTVLIQILMRRAYPISLGAIVQSDMANSFYTPAMRYSPIEILSQYSVLAPSLPLHAQSNMPGKILLFQFFKPFTSSPQVMGYLVILLSTIGALLLYGICKKLFHDRRAAFYALILYALVPGKLFFFPILNTVTPVLILLCLYLFVTYLEEKHIGMLVLLGGAFYLLVLFEPSPLVTGFIFLGVLLKAMGERRVSREDILRIPVITGLAFVGVYLIFRFLFSFDLLQAFQYVLSEAVKFNQVDERGYWIWIGENPKEFFYAAGLPVMMIFVYMVMRMFSGWQSLRVNITRWSMETLYVSSLLLTLGVVVFLGVNRGEITRLWIYLGVFFQVPAAVFLARGARSGWLFLAVACTLALQSIVTLQRVGFVIP